MSNILQVQSVQYNENRRVVEAKIKLSVSFDSLAILSVYIGMSGDKLYVENIDGPYDIASLLQWSAWLGGHEALIIETIKESLQKNR